MSKFTDSTGREVELTVWGSPDDIQIDECIYSDDGSEVPETEVDWISENAGDALYEMYLDRQVGLAEAYYEGRER